MAKQERFVLLEENIVALRNLGTTWDLDEETVDSCAQLSLKMKTDDCNGLFRSFCLLGVNGRSRTTLTVALLVIVVSGVAVGYAVLNNDRISQWITEDMAYVVMRRIRLMTVFLQSLISISGYYDAQCIVYNPLWKDIDQAECDICESLNHVREFKNKGEVLDLDLYESPLIHKNLLPRVVSLEDVTAVVQRSKVKLSTPVKSSASWSRTAREFADNATVDKIKNSHEFYFHWTSLKNILVGQIMRTIFPRPHIFSKELEVSLDKYLYVDGPNTKGYQLENFIEPGYDWYSQGFGVRTLQFSPCNKTCATQCPAFHITVSQRDVLTYVRGIWDVSVLDNGEDLSISYMGHLVSF